MTTSTLKTTYTTLLFALLLGGCVEENPDYCFPGECEETGTGGTGEGGDDGGEPLGTAWCAHAVDAEVSFGVEPVPVPAEYGGPTVLDENGDWLFGCTCADDSLNKLFMSQSEAQGEDGTLVTITDGQDGALVVARNEAHANAQKRCHDRALEIAEAFFLGTYLPTLNWDDFKHLTSHTCIEVLIDMNAPLVQQDPEQFQCVVGDEDPHP